MKGLFLTILSSDCLLCAPIIIAAPLEENISRKGGTNHLYLVRITKSETYEAYLLEEEGESWPGRGSRTTSPHINLRLIPCTQGLLKTISKDCFIHTNRSHLKQKLPETDQC